MAEMFLFARHDPNAVMYIIDTVHADNRIKVQNITSFKFDVRCFIAAETTIEAELCESAETYCVQKTRWCSNCTAMKGKSCFS